MNVDGWDYAEDITELLAVVQTAASLRKLRLFICGCCRAIWDVIPIERWRSVVETAEQFAEGDIPWGQLQEGKSYLSRHLISGTEENAVWQSLHSGNQPSVVSATYFFCSSTTFLELGYRSLSRMSVWKHVHQVPQLASHQILRDVICNPFRPVAFDPAWRTDTVLSLARVMYDTRDFAGMPILADALQDAGCEHAVILDHCRGTSTHVRGCWVVDLVLGKA
jgi:hypothetical protein